MTNPAAQGGQKRHEPNRTVENGEFSTSADGRNDRRATSPDAPGSAAAPGGAASLRPGSLSTSSARPGSPAVSRARPCLHDPVESVGAPGSAPARARIQRTADHLVMELASRQHGVVTRSQLLEVGVTRAVIERRLAVGLLNRIHGGVYRVGPLETPDGRALAAVLACGDGTVVSHRSAGALWQLPSRGDGHGVEVIVRRGRGGARSGIVVYRIRTLRAAETTVRNGVPLTTPARTLLDLAAVVSDRELERAVAEAFALRLAGPEDIRAVLAGRSGRPGASRLLRLLAHGPGTAARTRSEAEERLLTLVRRAGLPAPATNIGIAGCEVDFLWRKERLVVEVDGRAFHSARDRFERDRRRDAALLAAGYRVLRVTWEQIVKQPESLLVTLTRVLMRQG